MARMTLTTIKPTRTILSEKLTAMFDELPRGAKTRFAKLCGVNQSIVTRWIDGNTDVDAGTIDVIAEKTEQTQSDLFDENVKIPLGWFFTN